MRIFILISLILVVGVGCGKETPVAPLRIEDPPPEPAPKQLPKPKVTISWVKLSSPEITGWRPQIRLDFDAPKTQELIDALDHYRIEYRPSAYNDYTANEWRPGGYMYDFPHIFQVWSPPDPDSDHPGTDPDLGCFDVRYTTVAKEGSGYVDSETHDSYIYAYKDYSHWIRGKQPNCWGLDDYSGVGTPWRNFKLHFKQGG